MTEFTPQLRSTLSTLITANHILSHHSLVDAFGHVSVRSPSSDPSTFFMTGNPVPAAVSGENDLAHYHVSDASPVIPGDVHSSTNPFSERFIHSEIYRRWPGVRAVVHSHARDVVVAGVSGVEVRPFWHMAGFLGERVPVWDIAEGYDDDDDDGKRDDGKEEEGRRPRHMLVNSCELGGRLAEAFGGGKASKGENEGIMELEVEGTATEMMLPECTVVLQRGHGFTTWGESVQEAVYRAYYTLENVRVQMAATDHSVVALGEVRTVPLSAEEIRDTSEMIKPCVFKSWALWSREVEFNPMYRNDLSGTSDADTAQKFWRKTLHNRMLPF